MKIDLLTATVQKNDLENIKKLLQELVIGYFPEKSNIDSGSKWS